jgi:hypothetical protein
MNIKNLDDLKKFTDEIRSQAGYKDPIAFAIGRSIKGKSAKTISVNYAVVNMNENYGGNFTGMTSNPIVEQGRERCVYRNIYHEVPHVCPINTRIINNHIYRHTYQPRYTCSEENVVTNEQCGSCCNFR